MEYNRSLDVSKTSSCHRVRRTHDRSVCGGDGATVHFDSCPMLGILRCAPLHWYVPQQCKKAPAYLRKTSLQLFNHTRYIFWHSCTSIERTRLSVEKSLKQGVGENMKKYTYKGTPAVDVVWNYLFPDRGPRSRSAHNMDEWVSMDASTGRGRVMTLPEMEAFVGQSPHRYT